MESKGAISYRASEARRTGERDQYSRVIHQIEANDNYGGDKVNTEAQGVPVMMAAGHVGVSKQGFAVNIEPGAIEELKQMVAEAKSAGANAVVLPHATINFSFTTPDGVRIE